MRICIVSLFAYPLFDAAAEGNIGGAEVRAFTFARGLAATGRHDVHFVVRSQERLPPKRIGDITVHFLVLNRLRTRDLAPGASRLWRTPVMAAQRLARSAWKRLVPREHPEPTLREVYCRLKADVYCVFGVSNHAADLVKSAQRIGKQTVLFATADVDFSDLYYAGSREIGLYSVVGHLCHYALSRADEIVVQTPWQQNCLRERFGRAATIIRNPIDVSLRGNYKPAPDGRFALWIGREDTFHKRPDRCMQLARKCPEIPFVMVINKRQEESYAQLLAGAPPNVRVIESVPFHQADDYYHAAAVFLNTSEFEGFPNAFLQATKHGTPILSLEVDPDGMLARHGCGAVAGGDLDCMAEQLRRIWAGGPEVSAIAAAGRRYVQRYHALDGRIAELESLLGSMHQSGADRRSARAA